MKSETVKIEFVGNGSGRYVLGIGAIWKGKPFECTREQFEALPEGDYAIVTDKPKASKKRGRNK